MQYWYGQSVTEFLGLAAINFPATNADLIFIFSTRGNEMALDDKPFKGQLSVSWKQFSLVGLREWFL